jgi:NADPH2:quinone reductase
MKAVLIACDDSGAPQPRLVEVTEASPGPREVLVRVLAAGMNRADLSLKTGHFRAITGSGPAGVAGLEMAGEVVGYGPEVRGFGLGDKVMAMCSGAHAERVCVDERLLMRVPAGVEAMQAAAWPAALMTAHDALVSNGRLARGDHVLVQAASSVVGIAAVQLARLLGAEQVIGTSTSADKWERLRALGATLAAHSGPTLEAAVREATRGHGVDVVVDHLGAPALAENMASAALGARIVSVGRMGGTAGAIDLDLLSLKRLSLIGVTFRTRTVDDVAALIARMLADVAPLLQDGRFSMPIDKVFALEDVAEAHAWMKSRQQFGKVILQP